MSALRFDQFLAMAGVLFILAAPVSALGQQTEPSTSPPTGAVQTSAPAPALKESQAHDRLASLDPADRAIAERMRALLDTTPNRIFADEKVRAAVDAFYQKRNLVPLWLDKGVENGRSKTVIARLKDADSDGLDHADYKIPVFNGLSPEGLAGAELTLMQTLLTYARHLQAGRVPHRLVREDNIALPQRAPDPAVVLAAVANADDAGRALEQFSPPYENYQKLKAALAQLRGRTGGGAHDRRRIDTIIANMERWRWYHREIRTSRVEVNEPDFTLKVIHDGRQVWTTRVVIGKPSMPSPLLAQQMDSITVNPTWKVPASIVRNEYVPAEARQPGTLARKGMRMKRVNGEVEITMPPGGQNPLGHIRFNFFNRLTVFQHDTPDQYLFAHVVRAESHGCMRVQDAPKYAEVLANIVHPEEQWTAAKIKRLYADSPEHEISLDSGPIWIYLTYQTAFVDDAGKLQIRRDLYNLDSRTLAAIKAARENGEPPSEGKSGAKMATPRPAAPAHRRKSAHINQDRS